jgi:hypothetical protein
MNLDAFCQLLVNLVRGAAESGFDVFFIHSELTLAGMQLVDECRVDLVVTDDGEGEAPY